MENKELPQSILDALEIGPFTSLAKSLQKKVLEHMTEAEYNDYHMFISDFKSLDSSLENSIRGKERSINNSSQANNLSQYLSISKAIIIAGLIALFSFYLGRVSVSNECPDESNSLIFAYQDTLGSSLAEDTIQRKLWSLFDKEVL